MKFDLIQLINGKQRKIEVHTIMEKDSFIFGGEEVKFSSPITLNGVFTKKGEEYIFKGNFETSVLVSCSRCLEKFNKNINMDLEEVFSKHESNEEVKEIDNTFVNLYEMVEEVLLLNLPIKRLCKESCKGLCPNCGGNLNHTICSCSIEQKEDIEEPSIDSRFAKLKNLLKDNK